MSKASQKHHLEDEYTKQYGILNREQKAAVDTVEGPVMVVAGPGTGKTQIIAMRIASILRNTDVSATNILALTFTESGVSSMRARLLSIIGEEAYYVNISTFHSFCSGVIQEHPEYFQFDRNAQPLSDLDRYTYIKKILLDSSFEYIKPINSPQYYVDACVKSIQNLKRENVTPERYRELIDEEENLLNTVKLSAVERQTREKNIHKNKELLKVYIEYQNMLVANNKYDFEDMITLTVKTFQSDALLLQTYQEQYQYILVDEFQDTNSAQAMILKLLTSYWGPQANIFVVGDSDQSLYRFQGASIENDFEFLEQFPQAKIISLKENYRSLQPILDASFEVIKNNIFSLKYFLHKFNITYTDEPLRSQETIHDSCITVAPVSSETLEAVYVAEQINTLHSVGTEYKDIAVIVRNNVDTQLFEEVFSKWGVPYVLDKGVNVLTNPIIGQFITLLNVIEDIRKHKEDVELFTLLSYEWMECNPLDILKLSRLAATKNVSIYEAVLQYKLSDAEISEEKRIKQIIDLLQKWSKDDIQLSLPEFFEKVLSESGYLDWILRNDKYSEHSLAIRSFFETVKTLAQGNREYHLSQFLLDISTMKENNLSILQDKLNIQNNAVTIITAHKSKGLEWEHVFITTALDKKWGNQSIKELIHLPDEMLKHVNLDKKDKNEDERRLFYVAMTRAKKHVWISYPTYISNSGKKKQVFPTMFVQEIPSTLCEMISTESMNEHIQEYMKKLISPVVKSNYHKEQEWLKPIIDEFVLTPTALNTYLLCSYKFKLNNLIRVPKSKADYLAFGSAIHKALEMLHRSLMKSNEVPSKEYVLLEYEKALEKEILSQKAFDERLFQGRKVLSYYYDEYRNSFKQALFVEKKFNTGTTKIYLNDIPIGGRIDKIEKSDSNDSFVVVDYKTGAPKSKNDIEGKTASSDGSYKRQLIFYKLLVELNENFKKKVTIGVFDFVEADKKGNLKQISCALTQEDVDELKNVITRVMESIRKQEFPRTTDISICKRCEFQHHCFPNGVKESISTMESVDKHHE